MTVAVKICGLTARVQVETALEHGADYIGFVFVPKSPRAVTPEQARELGKELPAHLKTVALFVNPDDAVLDTHIAKAAPDMVQLHGSEPPERVKAIRARFGLPVIKALPVATAADLKAVPLYEPVADMLLFDAKPPVSADNSVTGGHGQPFDWTVLAQMRVTVPWMVSGGLNAINLEEAVRITGASAVDVSSGVEEQRGRKSPRLIAEFLARAKALSPDAPDAGSRTRLG